MSKFYGDEFEILILEIQKKFANNENLQNFEEDSKEHRLELLEKNNIEQSKQDMWHDTSDVIVDNNNLIKLIISWSAIG